MISGYPHPEEEENEEPPPLEQVELKQQLASASADDDYGGLDEAILKEIAEAVQVRFMLITCKLTEIPNVINRNVELH